ncbi:TerD family protein [Nocardia ignorata]|uniref:Tellurium resistance protein TerZ n=1 Tax=Nocardia ignorata TaxID=145285 RepID=A0A4R6PKR1_NOCIG|nr:TerD family protein [Nocardia ignorata]TDP38396.1 tellurium resistance protein TerZ [Nocardia ignorata]
MTGALTLALREPLRHITIGLGWDTAAVSDLPGSSGQDINAAALSYVGHRFVDVAFREQPTSRDGAIRHLDNDVTGDKEAIVVDLTRLKPMVTTVMFIVTCYSGQGFHRIDNGFCRVVDTLADHELARIELASARSHTGLILGKLCRENEQWAFRWIDEPIWAQHVVTAIPQLTGHLG